MLSRSRRQELIRLHCHPETGSRFWLKRLSVSGLDWKRVADAPDSVPPVTADELRACAIEDLLPRPLLGRRPFLVTGETSGFSGQPVITCFSLAEFQSGFVTPFIEQARRVGFPLATTWLWAGPCGPHLVGKALREILRTVGGTDPFTVDFDPRWYRKQVRGSLSARRYFQHILDQIDDVLSRQPVEVLYATPPIVQALAERLSIDQRNRVHGVHYAGMAMDAAEYEVCRRAFQHAVHMSGYGNSLFGMFPETGRTAEGIEYATDSERVEARIVRLEEGRPVDCTVGSEGQVMLSRFDETVLIMNMVQEDVATRTERGFLNPHRPHHELKGRLLY